MVPSQLKIYPLTARQIVLTFPTLLIRAPRAWGTTTHKGDHTSNWLSRRLSQKSKILGGPASHISPRVRPRSDDLGACLELVPTPWSKRAQRDACPGIAFPRGSERGATPALPVFTFILSPTAGHLKRPVRRCWFGSSSRWLGWRGLHAPRVVVLWEGC